MNGATDPAAAGPYPAAQTTVTVPGTQGAGLTTDLYYPGDGTGLSPGAGKCPVILLGHGFLQSRNNHVNQGLHLATRGYIVLIPDSNEASNHSRYADDLIQCLNWIEAQGTDPASIFSGRVRADRTGATGHSAGGLSAILAASRDSRIRAVAPMDPVDNGGLGEAALPQVAAPVAITYSEPSICNANGSGLVLYNAATAPKRGIRIVGANHTDPQDPPSFTSILLCGGANSTRQALYRRYVTGWFDYHLREDALYGPWAFNLPGGQLEEDLLTGQITHAEDPAPIEAWRFVHFGPDHLAPPIAGDEADPDADGWPNLMEYALHTNPLAPDPGPVIESSLLPVGEDRYVSITFPLVTAATDITYQIQTSSTLLEWIPGSSYSGQVRTPDTGATTEVSQSGSGLESITVRDNVPTTSGPRFLQLQVRRWRE
ncbi:MAG: alpha/beta hydrolase family protein [Oceanipulchritudo sp.]